MKSSFLLLVLSLVVTLSIQNTFAQTPELNPEWFDLDGLPQGMTAEEELRRHEIGMNFQATPPPAGPVRNIAEFERNEGVLIRWPLGISLALIAAMSEHVTVTTLVANQSQETQARNAYQSAGVNMDNAEFLHAPTNSVWTRDYGPFYVVDENHQVSIVDFIYNRPRPLDDAVNSTFAGYLDIPLYAMDLEHTGGNYMSTGWGAAASTDLIWEENGHNQPLVLEQMYDYMGINPYHVTIDPMDPNGIKHIDTFAKFLDVDKVIIGEVPQSDPRYNDYESVVAYYESQNSPWGTPYQVYRVYSPNGQPYTNSLIVNERIYVPITNSAWDEPALESYREAMPGYEVLGFTGSWFSNDALHCRVKEVADRGMLSIQHMPVTEVPPARDVFELYADIIPYSGADLIEDELFLIYRSNGAPFDTLALSHTGGHTFSAGIPYSTEEQEITYYFSASDASGRTETWPLIGPAGARSFTLPGFVSSDADPSAETVRIEALYPNPATGPVTVRYNIDSPGTVRAEVFDVMGRRVIILDEASQSAGRHTHTIDTRQLAPGTYVYRLTVDSVRHSQRFVVAR